MNKGYQVEFEKQAQMMLKQMELHQSYLILSWIKQHLVNSDNPRYYGYKLAEQKTGEWIYKIGNYRLIAYITENIITLLAIQIGHGKNCEKSLE